MIYTAEIKNKLDDILKAFHPYIQGQDDFDIVYSEKLGYVMILAKRLGDASAIHLDTPEKMLDILFEQVIYDVVHAPENKSYVEDAVILSEYEEAESRRQLTAILKNISDGKDQYLAYLDSFLNAYQEASVKD